MSKDKEKKYSLDEFKKKFGNDDVQDKTKDLKRLEKKLTNNIHSKQKTFIPDETNNVITQNSVDNFSLKLNKFAQFDEDKFSFYKTEKGGSNYNNVEGFKFNGVKFHLLCKEISESAKILFPNFNEKLELEIDWRLAIGLGTESVYETSINLHPIYGFPFIPGQAVKGIVRSWIIQEHFDSEEKKAFQNEAFCYLFGCPKESVLKKEHQGSLVFFDAYPTSAPNLKVDVMNPHYAPYYSDNSNKKPPADYYNPVPIFFVTVEKTKFQFIIGIRDSENEVGRIKSIGGTYFELGKQFLKEALTQKGVGAKTAVGYGYFKE
jgi:CRISPR-associated protein Cmr6